MSDAHVHEPARDLPVMRRADVLSPGCHQEGVSKLQAMIQHAAGLNEATLGQSVFAIGLMARAAAGMHRGMADIDTVISLMGAQIAHLIRLPRSLIEAQISPLFEKSLRLEGVRDLVALLARSRVSTRGQRRGRGSCGLRANPRLTGTSGSHRLVCGWPRAWDFGTCRSCGSPARAESVLARGG